MIEPHCNQTAKAASEHAVILSIGDTTFIDYDRIVAKQRAMVRLAKVGKLILHSTLTLTPEQGQPLGLLWQTMWHREPLAKPPENETPEQKKQRQREARRAARQRPFEAKESYRWVEALEQGTKRVKGSTKVIHIFDREGDITIRRQSSWRVKDSVMSVMTIRKRVVSPHQIKNSDRYPPEPRLAPYTF